MRVTPTVLILAETHLIASWIDVRCAPEADLLNDQSVDSEGADVHTRRFPVLTPAAATTRMTGMFGFMQRDS